jgi:hypothetical protein
MKCGTKLRERGGKMREQRNKNGEIIGKEYNIRLIDKKTIKTKKHLG